MPYGSRKWRRKPEPGVPELYSWNQLESLISASCLSRYLNLKEQPTYFRVYGYLRADYGPMQGQAQPALQLDVSFNPHRKLGESESSPITVHRSWFDFSLRRIREDFEHVYRTRNLPVADYKKGPKILREKPEAPPVGSAHVGEPPPNEYPCIEPSGTQQDPMNEWQRHFEEDDWAIRKARRA